MTKIEITQVKEHQLDEVLSYVIDFRQQLFPMLNANVMPKDLQHFKAFYLESKTGTFLQARDENGRLVGTIGMMPYDFRFPHLYLSRHKTVEVARLFVEPAYRRQGLGSELFLALQQVAERKEIERLYLHTHPFLTGAYEFWQRQGFDLIKFCQEGGFPTLHMEKLMVEALDYANILFTDKQLKDKNNA